MRLVGAPSTPLNNLSLLPLYDSRIHRPQGNPIEDLLDARTEYKGEPGLIQSTLHIGTYEIGASVFAYHAHINRGQDTLELAHSGGYSTPEEDVTLFQGSIYIATPFEDKEDGEVSQGMRIIATGNIWQAIPHQSSVTASDLDALILGGKDISMPQKQKNILDRISEIQQNNQNEWGKHRKIGH